MTPSFVVAVQDLERGPRELTWTMARGWLDHALAETEARAVADGRLVVELSKTGRDVLVRGRAEVRVTTPDARTLEPVELDLTPEIFLMLSPASASTAPVAAPRAARRKQAGTARAPKSAPEKPHRGWSDDPELGAEDAAHDTYKDDRIVLDDFVREFLLLELPMVVRSGLPLGEPAANPPPSPEPSGERRVDPRLAPLAAIADRLRGQKP